MPFDNLVLRVHAIRRMFSRSIGLQEVKRVLKSGKKIETYPSDKPFPSYLILGFIDHKAIHVVAADDNETKQTIIITVYEPDPQKWDNKFEKRRGI